MKKLNKSLTIYGREIHRTPGNSVERDIPDLTIDDSGFARNGGVNLQIPDTGTITSCGITQNTIEARIADCNYSWDGESKGKMGEGKWSLVTKANGKEVWRDDRTGLVWSELVNGVFSWCKASGNRENAGGVNCSANTVSVCAEAEGLNSDGFDEVKGGMRKTGTAISPSVRWRLPTLRDYLQAYANGWAYVFTLKDAHGTVHHDGEIAWTATVSSTTPNSAYVMYAEDSDVYILSEFNTRNENGGTYVRCVGQ